MTKPTVKKNDDAKNEVNEVESTSSKDLSLNITEDFYGNSIPPTSETSISLAWKDVLYTITDSKTKRQKDIVKKVSGIVKPGEVLASKCYHFTFFVVDIIIIH